MQRVILRFYGVLFCLFFAFIVTAQVLSFLGLYRPLFVFPLSLAAWAGSMWLYFRVDNGWVAQTFPPEVHLTPPGSLRRVILGAALFLPASAFLFRLVIFPYSSISANLPTDAIGYHFVKAIELARTGTMWDLSMLYGEYPVGFESLLAAGILLTRNLYLAGVVHALALVLLVLTLCLLVRRYTRLPLEIALLFGVALLFYPDLYSATLLIGKNYLLLSTLLLAAVLHSPLAPRHHPDGVHPFGLAFATSMAMSVKPGGYLILGFLWLVVLVRWGAAYRQGKARAYLPLRLFIAAVILMVPCGFWVIRNVAMMGRLVSPEVATFFQGSIFASLGDPVLYAYGTESLALIGLSLWYWLLAGLVYLTRRFTLPVVLVLPVMWLAFITTPLSAFHTVERNAVHIEWRYTTHLFLLMAILCLAMLEYVINRLYRLAGQQPALVTAGLVAGCAALMIAINPADLFAYRPENALHLQDPYPEPVGVDGYRSVYDYIQRELHNTTLVSIGATAYYLYAPPYTNVIFDILPQPMGLTEPLPRPVPDYLVYMRRDWQTADQYLPEDTLMPPYHWEIVYEDPKGILYRRNPSSR